MEKKEKYLAVKDRNIQTIKTVSFLKKNPPKGQMV